MKKIAIYMPTFLNFSETFIYALVDGLSKFKPVVICREQKNSDLFPFKDVFVVNNKRNIKKVLKEQNIALIHAQYGVFGADIMGVANQLNIPLICHFRGQDAYQLSRDFFVRLSYKRLFKKAARILTVSEHMKNQLISLGCSREKAQVYYGGIPLGKFKPKPAKQSAWKLLMAGRLTAKKGLEVGLASARALVDEGYQFTLKIVGEGEMKAELEKMINQLELAEYVSLVGKLPHNVLLTEIQDSDFLLAPHRVASNGDSEGIPNVIKEAMSAGTVVVTTDHSGIPELVHDGFSGFVAREADIASFSEKLKAAFNLIDISELQNNARKVLERDFDITKQTKKLEQIYADVLEGED